jgi:hypothetical protein
MSDTPPILSDANKIQPVDLPTWAVSQFSVSVTSNEVLLVGSEITPLLTPEGVPDNFARVRPRVVFRMSPQTMKDLSIILSEALRKYEGQFGVLNTDYTKTHQK